MTVTSSTTQHFPSLSTKTVATTSTTTKSATTSASKTTTTKSTAAAASSQKSAGYIKPRPPVTFAWITSTKAVPTSLDFTTMTKADFLAWGKQQYASGRINQDDMFRVQFESGELNGSTKTDTVQHNFVKTFQDRVQFLNGMGSSGYDAASATSYTHLLSVMTGSVSTTA